MSGRRVHRRTPAVPARNPAWEPSLIDAPLGAWSEGDAVAGRVVGEFGEGAQPGAGGCERVFALVEEGLI
jgi:hypothetical protein